MCIHVFFVSNFLTWQILFGKKWKKNSRKNINNKKFAKKLGFGFFKKKT